jgi:seryl-tRNA synthetase
MFSSSRKIRRAIEAMVAEVNELRQLVNDQAARIDAETQRNHDIIERVNDIESRITGMGAELSRQLHELGNDIDELSKRADDDATVLAVDALKAAQIRLATEQARYEITFRRDLADLADQLLRRPR